VFALSLAFIVILDQNKDGRMEMENIFVYIARVLTGNGKGQNEKDTSGLRIHNRQVTCGQEKRKEKKNHWLFKVVKRVDYFVVALQFVTCDKKRNLEKGDATQ